MAKTGLLPGKPRSPEAAADAWVNGGSAAVVASAKAIEPTIRMTFDLPSSLHKRVRLCCAEEGTKMATVIRQMLEERFPAGK